MKNIGPGLSAWTMSSNHNRMMELQRTSFKGGVGPVKLDYYLVDKKSKVMSRFKYKHKTNYTLKDLPAHGACSLINKKVAVPANSCFSVVQAILYSGNFPKFYDIDENNFSINYKLIKRY